MNFPLCFLLILLAVSHLSSRSCSCSCSPMRKVLEDHHGIHKATEYSSLDHVHEKPLVDEGDDHDDDHDEDHQVIQRKYLHEVHSGPNPIGNSVPQQRWKTRLRNP